MIYVVQSTQVVTEVYHILLNFQHFPNMIGYTKYTHFFHDKMMNISKEIPQDLCQHGNTWNTANAALYFNTTFASVD